MGEPFPGMIASKKTSDGQLNSWKEIAAYLNRDVTTVQRWEKREAMPVRRHLHDKRGSVYALVPELDAWLQSRRAPVGEESETKPETKPDSKEEAKEQDPELLLEGEAGHRRRALLRPRGWLALTVVGVLGLLALAYGVYRTRTRTAAEPKIRSLAVLPLKNLSADPTQEYLSDGMTDALIDHLSRVRGLRVISRTSVMRFKNPQLSVPEIAKLLHVDAIVEGSVMRQDNRIRVTAQLIRGTTDEHFWSETYDRDLRDVFAVQSELAQSIAEKVQATATGEVRRNPAPTRSVAPEVYESYLKGRFTLDKSNDRAGVEESIRYFDRAIQMDPTFAPAYAGLANAYSDLGTVFVGVATEQTRPKEISAARKALELEPDIAEAHDILAEVWQEQFHWADAERE